MAKRPAAAAAKGDDKSKKKKKRSKGVDDNFSFRKLHSDCILQADVTARTQALSDAVQNGILAQLWSQLPASDFDGEDWRHGCLVFCALLCWKYREGTHTATLDDCGIAFDDNFETKWNACLDTICAAPVKASKQADKDDPNQQIFVYDAWTRTCHFLTIVSCVAQWKRQLQTERLLHHVGAVTTTLWKSIPPRRRLLECKQHGMNEAIESDENDMPFVATLIHRMLSLIHGEVLTMKRDKTTNKLEEDDETVVSAWIFLHRACELLIDLLSSSREQHGHALAVYLDSLHFVLQGRLKLGTSANSVAEENLLLTQQLWERLEGFVLLQQAHGEQNEERLLFRRATTLQKLCHRYYAEQLPDLIYAGVGLLCSRTSSSFLKEALGGLTDEQLLELLKKLRLIDPEHAATTSDCGILSELYKDRDFLFQVLQEYLRIPQDPVLSLQSLPLYPTQLDLWNMNRIPPSHASLIPGASGVLCLPKLQTRYASFTDYLRRSFDLHRWETAYDIRSDLVSAIQRLRPVARVSVQDDDEEDRVASRTEFTGWARMAVELDGPLLVKQVSRPQLGYSHPAQVIAEMQIDLDRCGDAIKSEWLELGEFDNVFLVAIDAGSMSGQPAPTLRDYHRGGRHTAWDTDGGDRPVPAEEDATFPKRLGVTLVRGCMIQSVIEEEEEEKSNKRRFRVALDPAQYAQDLKQGIVAKEYEGFNLVVRRQGRENNFKSVLETIRGLLMGAGAVERVLPIWLQPVLLGQGDDASAAHYDSPTMREFASKTAGVAHPEDALDFGDSFVSEKHLRSSFPNAAKITIDGREEKEAKERTAVEQRLNHRIKFVKGTDDKESIEVTSYKGSCGGNAVPFTPVQVEAIRSGLNPGLTLIVGPPGTGKTDVAVQILASLFHSFPTQRTVIVTHSNAALNDLFAKVMMRGDVPQRYMVRLGAGERDLQVDSSHDFTKAGRVDYSLARRGVLLEQVQCLSESLGQSGKAERGENGAPSYTCETAAYFHQHYLKRLIRQFEKQCEGKDETFDVASISPFSRYFGVAASPSNESAENKPTVTLSQAKQQLARLEELFSELAEYRPLELLRSQRQKTDYLLMKQARIVAMTCTHAAIARSHLVDLGFEYDNILVEEAGQMTEIETFIPFLLQQPRRDGTMSNTSRCKRICLLGDHNQLPPIVRNQTFANYSHLDHSMFLRLIKLGVKAINLDKQGRTRPEIANLYNWRYQNLGNLPHVNDADQYKHANAGFVHTYQLINVDNFQGRGESTPTAYFYQNVGEAEYAVALFQYMVLIGYPPKSISILTTYNGQKALINDILSQRCGAGTPLEGLTPRIVSTVDQYQGQQNDYIILSLVRTERIGHLRDVRRLVVAVSRARLGLYVLGRQDLFGAQHDLKPTFDLLGMLPTKLQLVVGEHYPSKRLLVDDSPEVYEVEDVEHMGSIVHQMQQEVLQKQQQAASEEVNEEEKQERARAATERRVEAVPEAT